MPRNIYIVGAQCTGKTTLVSALKHHFEKHKQPSEVPLTITEVARTVLKLHSFTANDITSSKSRALELQRLIIEAQYAAEKAAGARWLISDRSGFDPVIYAMRYVGSDEAETLMGTRHWQELKTRMSGSLIVVCEAGIDWLNDDGVRLMPVDKEDWIAFHDLFCQTLKKAGMSFVILPHSIKDLQERVDFVLKLLED